MNACCALVSPAGAEVAGGCWPLPGLADEEGPEAGAF
jgi:hypothetical protein